VAARHAPATERNRDPIAAVLREVLPKKGVVLEIASGTGEHAVHFARLFGPHLIWLPSDPDEEALASIRARREEALRETPLLTLMEPKRLDAASDNWPVERCDAIVCINMVHISPWAATEGLMRGAGTLLAPGAPLILYGPYRQRTKPTAPSNEAFDQSLKARNPHWGLRAVEDVAAEGEKWGLALERTVEMPANNLSLVFRRL